MTLMLICALLWKNIHKDSITTFIRLQHTPSWIGIMNHNRPKAVDWAHLSQIALTLAKYIGTRKSNSSEFVEDVASLSFLETVTSVSSWHVPLAQMVKAGSYVVFMIGIWKNYLRDTTQLCLCTCHVVPLTLPTHTSFLIIFRAWVVWW